MNLNIPIDVLKIVVSMVKEAAVEQDVLTRTNLIASSLSKVDWVIGYLEGLRDGVGTDDEAGYQSLLGLFAREIGPERFNSDKLQAEIRAL